MTESTFKIPLLREIAQAISHLSSDRALLFLIETAVSVTASQGAILMKPHEKLSEMVPLVDNLPGDPKGKPWHNGFFSECFRIFLEGETCFSTPCSSHHKDLGLDDTVGHAVVMPLSLSGKPVALFFIYHGFSAGAFETDHQTFLDILAPFLATLVENFRLQNDMIHKNSRLFALYEISQRAESLIDFRDVYDSLSKVAKSFIHFDAYLLYLFEPKTNELILRGTTVQKSFPQTLTLGEGQIGIAALERKPYLTFTDEYKSVLILPIVVSENLIGVLTIASRKSYAYRDEDIIGLRIISTQIASIDQIFKDLLRLRGVTEHILESMTSGVLIFDNNRQVTFSNPEMTRLLTGPVPERWSPDANEADIIPLNLKKLIADVLTSKLTLENQRIKLDSLDPPKIVEVNSFPFRDEQGEMQGTAFFMKDFTQMTRLEDQLKRADRLSALGVLAAGIAHEIRNPLTGMKMIVQLLISDFPAEDQRREPLGIIQKEIDRLEKIIVNLLDFAKPSKPKAEQISLYEVLDACLFLVMNQAGKLGANVEKVFPAVQPQMIGDPNQLKQVFLNILTNALHAISPGGTIRLSVEHNDQWVIIAVKDTGIGIPQERLKGIFDPFMTTKEDGTGLGLSMALRIVEEHGGRIEVDSVEGCGSTFSVYLPQSSNNA